MMIPIGGSPLEAGWQVDFSRQFRLSEKSEAFLLRRKTCKIYDNGLAFYFSVCYNIES